MPRAVGVVARRLHLTCRTELAVGAAERSARRGRGAVDHRPDAPVWIAGDSLRSVTTARLAGSSIDASSADAITNTFVPDAGDAGPTTTAVAHTREFRAMWVTTVFRLDFPTTTTLTPAQAQDEISAIVNEAASAGLNAIYFQVRSESDAFYPSKLEPWSRFASGTQGTSPGYDPLAIFISTAHAKGIEVHAWLNPYRAMASLGVATAPSHVTKLYPDAAITYGTSVTMNPADARVRSHIVDVVTEVTHDYDIDGVVFDDYFYPYPVSGTPFPDDASYDAYVGLGGTLTRSAWRRDNVNQLIAAVSTAVRAERPWVRWGVSPFGIYRPGMPAGVTGLDAYEAIACDSLHWIAQNWVDYLAPQLYWPSTSSGQPFGALVDWWGSKAKPNRPIFPTLALYKVGTAADWSRAEYETQIALSRGEANAAGQTHFRHAFLESNVANIKTSFVNAYAAPARPPVVPGVAGGTVAVPSATIAGTSVTLTHAAPMTIRGYAIYRPNSGTWELARWVSVGEAAAPIALATGSYAISAIDRGGVESLGLVVAVP